MTSALTHVVFKVRACGKGTLPPYVGSVALEFLKGLTRR